MRVEDLGPDLYLRASWRSTEIAMTTRDEYPQGAGMLRSVFTVQRSEPSSDEESWPIIQTVNSAGAGGTSDPNSYGASQVTWNQAYVGHLERQYGPEEFGLMGPTISQDELVLHWRSSDFWEKYYQALEKRNIRSLENRLRNVSMNMVPHCCLEMTGTVFTGNPLAFSAAGASKSTVALIAPDQVYLGDLPAPTISSGVVTNYSELTDSLLDQVAVQLLTDGATEPDSNGWIQMGPEGPVFPLEIGVMESQRLLTNNPDLRADIRAAWDTFAEANPMLQRLGASKVIKNFRYVPTVIPPRWDWVTTGNDGGAIGPSHLYTEPNSGIVYGAGTNALNTPYGSPAGCWVRRPVFVNSTSPTFVTKGQSAEINPQWTSAQFEGARVLSPWVFTEEILRPMGAISNQNWRAQNYLGEWQFVTGIDAFAGIAGCTVPTGGDPLHKVGRHFGEYRHAARPVFPQYGRLIIYSRCLGGAQTYHCS